VTPHAFTIAISPGELLDRISILQLKEARVADPAKRAHAVAELAALEAERSRADWPPGTEAVAADLAAVNGQLWDVEDDLRRCEREQDFGPHFVELARSVYRLNDRRTALKNAVNALLGSRLQEVKSYAGVPAGAP
jgi:hypothetical protein